MKKVTQSEIVEKLAHLIDFSLKNVEEETKTLICDAENNETLPSPKWALRQIRDNIDIAKSTNSYACQDCGLALVLVELGIDVVLDAPVEESINLGVIKGYENARKSVCDPLTRTNTNNNAPAIVYVETVRGDNLKISYLAKGAGSENMSNTYMLTPSKGKEGIINSVISCVKEAGANPCPPIILGIGIGGTMDKAAILSKKALLRTTNAPAARQDLRELEREIKDKVNALFIGAQGLGGKSTTLAVHIEAFPTHIGMLPVAVTIQCHSVRHGSIIL